MKYLIRFFPTKTFFPPFFFSSTKAVLSSVGFCREYYFLSGWSVQAKIFQQSLCWESGEDFSASETLKSTVRAAVAFHSISYWLTCLTVYVDKGLLRSLFWTFPSQLSVTLFTPSFWNQHERIFSPLFSLSFHHVKSCLELCRFLKTPWNVFI